MTGAELIAAERHRQVTVEGWSAEHDAHHVDGQLAAAAAAYALRPIFHSGERPPVGWPWDRRYWKPCPDDRIRELVKAGALLAAEIDRLLAVKAAKP